MCAELQAEHPDHDPYLGNIPCLRKSAELPLIQSAIVAEVAHRYERRKELTRIAFPRQ